MVIFSGAMEQGANDLHMVQLTIGQPRPTQPPTLSGREMNTSQSAVMLCGWGVKAGMVHSTCG